MSTLSKLLPTNLLEEKEKFFASNTYDPQFTYADEIDLRIFDYYNKPEKKLQDLASYIVDSTYASNTEEQLSQAEGKRIGKQTVERKIQSFLYMHNLSNKFEIVWSQSFLARASITEKSIKLKLPVDFREEGLVGMIYHELGTHAIRNVNSAEQPWYKKRKKFGLKPYITTEEGLASLHSLLAHSLVSAHIAAMRYVAICVAMKSSFRELWNHLEKYIRDPEKRWAICMRSKRGFLDTSIPGAFLKDLAYFEGTVKIWKWLSTHEFNPTDLYIGKIHHDDIPLAKELNPGYQPTLPSFFTLSPEKYAQKIFQIGEFNKFDQV